MSREQIAALDEIIRWAKKKQLEARKPGLSVGVEKEEHSGDGEDEDLSDTEIETDSDPNSKSKSKLSDGLDEETEPGERDIGTDEDPDDFKEYIFGDRHKRTPQAPSMAGSPFKKKGRF